MFAGCRRLRRIWQNEKALFRHLLLQIGGANIENPPTSSHSSPLGLVLAALARFVVFARRGKNASARSM
jgi:hypothetical protein